jgi:anti-anti-sigma factor
MKLELHATPEDVMRAVEVLGQLESQPGVSDRDLFALTLVLEESASNVVNHALKRDSTQKFHVNIEHTRSQIVIELRDRGPEFDPTLAVQKKTTEDEPSGGWGIELLRRYTDEMCYQREAGENILRLTRRLGKATGAKLPSPTDTKDTVKTKTNMSLEIKIQKSGTDTATVTLAGSLDTVTAPQLERELFPELADQIKELVFDLAQLKFVSSAGLRVFSTARKLLKQRGGQVAFVHLQPQIREVFEIIKALPGVAIFTDIAEMDRYLAARQHAHEQSTDE